MTVIRISLGMVAAVGNICAVAVYGPAELRVPIRRFASAHLSLAPENGEAPGVYVNKAFDPTADIFVAFYDGSKNHVLGKGVGGDDFLHASKLDPIDVRVNARNAREAVELLRRYLSERNFVGGIRGAAVFDHGSPAAQRLGRSKVGDGVVELVTQYRPQQGPTELYLFGCNVAAGPEGMNFIQAISDKHGLRVYASENYVEWMVWWGVPEGSRNFYMNKEDWFVAAPGGGGPERVTLTNSP